ncbi:MAG: twin-arginine translocase TatA/TatE family subunit [Clostridiales bacterium]|nr:twin-arginine translocase TatA/TatE family subunit [Clostridiales bacterium]
MRIGTMELLLVLFIAFLIFGPSRLPQIGESFGKAIKNFKKGFENNESHTSAPDDPE